MYEHAIALLPGQREGADAAPRFKLREEGLNRQENIWANARGVSTHRPWNTRGRTCARRVGKHPR
eukprot:15460691-Alexandrium_andersonii.AAC.1